ncbi:hypothetical protein M758_11G060500 [Ceratodon purpureus]|nr:hypothetical protein M758_11G060500 [Ceratodon purpureus]
MWRKLEFPAHFNVVFLAELTPPMPYQPTWMLLCKFTTRQGHPLFFQLFRSEVDIQSFGCKSVSHGPSAWDAELTVVTAGGLVTHVLVIDRLNKRLPKIFFLIT